MRLSSILMTLAALGLAVTAGVLAQTWLEQQRVTGEPVVVERSVPTAKVVIATQPLRFGAELNVSNIREVEWPASALPAGAFGSVAELTKSEDRRVVLSAIEPNEPILKWKITGPGQRASLSAVIGPDMKAVTIRVNDVNGIAGFVLPGDRVDVMLTRTEVDPEVRTRKKQYNDIVLQNVRVLGVDQLADDRSEQPVVAKAVTLEVKTFDAQRLTLASNVGALSLALRSAGATAKVDTKRVTTDDLSDLVAATKSAGVVPQVRFARRGKIGVLRSTTRSEYTVPSRNEVADTLYQKLKDTH